MIKENLDTSIDRLVEYINANESVSVTNAAKVLAMNPDEVEKLGEMLAESGLISIRYELTNTILTAKKKIVQKATLAPQSKPLTAEEGKKIEKQVYDTESIFEFIETDLNKRINIAQNNLKKLSQQANVPKEEVEKTEKEMQKIIEEVHIMENRVNELYKKVYLFDQQLQTFRENIKKLEVRKPSLIDRIKNLFRMKRKTEIIPESEVEEANEMKEKAKIMERKLEERKIQPLETKPVEQGKNNAKIEIPREKFEKIAQIRAEKKKLEKTKNKENPEKEKIKKIEKEVEKTKQIKKEKKEKAVKEKTKEERKIKKKKERKTHAGKKATKQVVRTVIAMKKREKTKVKTKTIKFKRNGVWIEAWIKNGRFFKLKEINRKKGAVK